MKKVIILIFFFISSCSSSNNIHGCCIGQKVVGNKNYVTVSNVWNEMGALPLAEEHCGQFKKSAKFKKMEGYRAIFDCVD